MSKYWFYFNIYYNDIHVCSWVLLKSWSLEINMVLKYGKFMFLHLQISLNLPSCWIFHYPVNTRQELTNKKYLYWKVVEWDLHILQPLSLHLRHSSFSNPSVALPTSQLILRPSRCFTYVTVHSPTLLSLLLRHKLFT